MRTKKLHTFESMETPISGDVISYPLYIENYQEIKRNVFTQKLHKLPKYLHHKMVCNQLLTYL